MRDYLSSTIVTILFRLFVKKFKVKELRGWKKKVYLSKLREDDPARWRVIKSREKGAKIGENCRLYSMNFFTEPNLVEIGNDAR